MSTTKILLGLAGGALVAGGVLYLLGRRSSAVADPTGAVAPPTGGSVKDTLAAGWDAVMGTHVAGGARTSVGDSVVVTATAQAEDTPIIGNRQSAVTDAQLATIGVFK